MADTSDERRDRIHALLQEMGPATEQAESALLTGWVIVASWVGPDGDEWLSKGHAAEIPGWVAEGMHHNALYGNWPSPDDEDG